MRRPRDIALRAGLYLAAALSGIAAAYIVREWAHHLWDARDPQRVLPDRDIPEDEKPDPQPEPSAPAHPRDEDQSPIVSDPAHTLSSPNPSPNADLDAHPPSVSQSKSLPPLRTHSLPPPPASAHALLSGSFVSINPDAMTSSSASSSGEDDIDEEDDAQTHASNSDSFADILSPSPAHVISRRRSNMRAHDLFAESHISFSELGSLVAPQDESV